MKNIILLFFFTLSVSCNGYSQQDKKTTSSESKTKVIVYFFHGTHRCTGCINAEKATVTVLNELYKNQQDNGLVKFQSVNIEESQNKALAEKYQVAWNMLLMIPVTNEKGEVELTEQAFTYGTNPEGLKPYIKKALDPMLK
ncbi:MAG TPA: nitrophenyl compound nitroreductase subunit ArsF family protein [Bacteroidales bacterium]